MIINHPICRSFLIAAIYLLTAVALSELRDHHVVSAETVVRMMGVLMGFVVFISANTISKRLLPLARLSCDPAREQNIRRVGSWALVLGGLGYTLAYALAPITFACTLAVSLLAPAVLVVAGMIARCALKRRNSI